MKAIVAVSALLLAGAAMAQTTPAAPATKPATPPDSGKVVISQGQTIAAAVAGMAKAANAMVVVDPAVTGRVTEVTAKLPLEQGLSVIAQANHAQWRKAYLKVTDIPKRADGTVDPVKLRAIVETAASVPNVTVGVYDPVKGEISMTTRQPANDAATVQWLQDKKVIYLLYRPAIVSSALGQTGDVVGDYITTQMNSMEAFQKMTPEQRAAAMKQGMSMVLNMDPKVMMEMAQQSMQALQNLSAEDKAKLFDLSAKMIGGMAGTPGQPTSTPQ